MLGVAGGALTLQCVQSALIQDLCVPGDLGDPAIETRLVGRDGELAIDAADGFALGDEQASQVFGEMTAFRGIGKQVGILGQEVLDESGKLDDRWHRSLLALSRVQQSLAIVRHFNLAFNFAKLQLEIIWPYVYPIGRVILRHKYTMTENLRL